MSGPEVRMGVLTEVRTALRGHEPQIAPIRRSTGDRGGREMLRSPRQLEVSI